MAVERIEEYRMKNGMDILMVHLAPAPNLPSGSFFFADAEDIDLVNELTWFIRTSETPYILAHIGEYKYNKQVRFHQYLAYKKLGYYPQYIDHRNGIEFDNIDLNLFNITSSENSHNKFIIGYTYNKSRNKFRGMYKLNGEVKQRYGSEYEACIFRNKQESENDSHYYCLELDRRDSLDILVEERKGIISEEEAIKKHLEKYKDNAWYYYRFGLEEWYKLFNWEIPKFTLDDIGYMRHHITNEKLSPYTHSSHVGLV